MIEKENIHPKWAKAAIEFLLRFDSFKHMTEEDEFIDEIITDTLENLEKTPITSMISISNISKKAIRELLDNEWENASKSIHAAIREELSIGANQNLSHILDFIYGSNLQFFESHDSPYLIHTWISKTISNLILKIQNEDIQDPHTHDRPRDTTAALLLEGSRSIAAVTHGQAVAYRASVYGHAALRLLQIDRLERVDAKQTSLQTVGYPQADV